MWSWGWYCGAACPHLLRRCVPATPALRSASVTACCNWPDADHTAPHCRSTFVKTHMNLQHPTTPFLPILRPSSWPRMSAPTSRLAWQLCMRKRRMGRTAAMAARQSSRWNQGQCHT